MIFRDSTFPITRMTCRPGAMGFALILLAATVLTPIPGNANDDSELEYTRDSFEFVGFDESELPPDAVEGLREIFSGRMFYSVMPLRLMRAMDEVNAARAEELGYDPSSPEGKFYTAGTLPSPPSRDSEYDAALGQSIFERRGSVVSNGNCFACHAGVVDGKIVAGLGNNNVMQRLPKREEAAQDMFAFASKLTEDGEREALAEIMQRMKHARAPEPEITNRGDNYGPFAVWAHGAQLADPASQGLAMGSERTELVELIESTNVPPVDPQPWWLMKYKVRDYWYGDGAPDDAAHFSFNFTGTQAAANEMHEEHVDSTAKALAFARATQSPIYPGSLDPDLVQQGADLFHGRVAPKDPAAFNACYECHGTYTRKAGHTDFSVPGSWDVDYTGSEELKKVRTDPTYNEVVQALRPVSEHINKLADYYDGLGTPELAPYFDHLEGRGYVAPPLVGVWATAPYFHNASVPTIEAVLNSELRPEIWARNQSPHAYDHDSVGMEYQELTRDEYNEALARSEAAPYLSRDSIDLMFIYDTQGFGRGNMGHTFGDTLTETERAAIIEFLKSLSGPDM